MKRITVDLHQGRDCPNNDEGTCGLDTTIVCGRDQTTIPENCPLPDVAPLINVFKNDEGYWLHFCDKDHNSAVISLDKVISWAGPIVKKTVLAACVQMLDRR